MRKKDLARRLAQETRQSEGAVADQLDEAIYQVLKSLRRRGNTAPNALQRLLEEAQCTTEEQSGRAKP